MVSHTIQLRVRWGAGVGEALLQLDRQLATFNWRLACTLLGGGMVSVHLEGPHDPGALAVIENFINEIPVQDQGPEGEQDARD